MTRYIELLRKQRAILISRAKSAASFELFLYRIRSPKLDGFSRLKAIGDIERLDRKIQKESTEFGKRRFRVMGNRF